MPGIQSARARAGRATRVDRLDRLLDESGLADRVRAGLEQEWTEGRGPERIRIRRAFATLRRPLPSGFSDRTLPPRHQRPPATRLIAPGGIALQTALTLLFVAQCTTPAGRRPDVTRPVVPRPDDHRRAWLDLLAAPADKQPAAGRSYTTVRDNRQRQVVSALDRLSGPRVRLVELPSGRRRAGRFDGFRLLDEGGDLGRVDPVLYQVPGPAADTFSLPTTFFLRGWHFLLSDAELALLLVLYSRSTGAPTPDEAIVLTGETRIRHHGLSPDAYATWRHLAAFGLVTVDENPRRRGDGTYEEYGQNGSDGQPLPHRLHLHDDAFAVDATARVRIGLYELGVGPRR